MAHDLHHDDLDLAQAPRAPGLGVAVIVNGGAGTGHGSALADRLHSLFLAHGMHADVHLATSGADMVRHARAALEGGVRTVVAGGGDGTVNAVASVVAGSGASLGVLPLGTLNHFAKDLRIPLALEPAVAVIARGSVRRIDVGEVNGRIFLNNSSLGLYPDIVREREQQQRILRRGKWAAALHATVVALKRFSFLSVRLCISGADVPRRTPFVFIGNNEYRVGGLALGARARLDGGHLSVYVAQRPGRLSLLRFALRALVGRLAQARDFDVLLVENMQIETRRKRLRVATDGEVHTLSTPLSYRVRPGALAVIVPG